MNTETQMEWTKYMLETYGKVSRNDALNKYFTRLGARIDDLKKEGYDITGKWVKYDKGKDYVYYLNRGQGNLI